MTPALQARLEAILFNVRDGIDRAEIREAMLFAEVWILVAMSAAVKEFLSAKVSDEIADTGIPIISPFNDLSEWERGEVREVVRSTLTAAREAQIKELGL